VSTWFAIAGGLAAWTAQLLASYALLDFGCARAGAPAGALVLPLVVISAACGGVALAATALAARRATAARGAKRGLYLGGVLLDSLSLVTIAFGAALPLLFDPCARG
jgi:hypothetical protein